MEWRRKFFVLLRIVVSICPWSSQHEKAGSVSCWQMLKSERPGWDGKGPEDLSPTWLLSNCLSDKDVFSSRCEHTALRGLQAFIMACFWRGSCWPCAQFSCKSGGSKCGGRRPACTLTWQYLTYICRVVIRMGSASFCLEHWRSLIPDTPLLAVRTCWPGQLGGLIGKYIRTETGRRFQICTTSFFCFEVECSLNTLWNLVFSLLCCW